MIYWRFDEKVRGFVLGNEMTGISLTLSWRPSVQYSLFIYGTMWMLGYDNVDGFVRGWGLNE